MCLKWLRMGFIVLAVGLFWHSPNSSVDFFTTLFIFAMGVLYDYSSIFVFGKNENDIYHKFLGFFGGVLASIFVLFAVFGLFNSIKLATLNELLYVQNAKFLINFSFRLEFFLFSMLVFPILAGMELYGEHKRYTRIPEVSARRLSA